MKKRILILTVDTGFGHRSAANAVAEALAETHGSEVECTMANPLEDLRTPWFIRATQSDYDKEIRDIPGIYRFIYSSTNKTYPTAIMQRFLSLFLYPTLKGIFERCQPDAVLSTYHLYSAPFNKVRAHAHWNGPFFCVITDLAAVHRLWFEPSPDRFFVANEVVHDEALRSGIPAERIRTSGIPVRTSFGRETRGKAELRRALGWDSDLPALLVVGSRRVGHILENLEAIESSDLGVQICVVAGGDNDLYRAVQSRSWRIPIHLENYTRHIPEMMRAADVLVTKAGGLVLSEGLACGLPILLVDIIAGQETGNAEYICQHGAGKVSHSPQETLDILSGWLRKDPPALHNAAASSRQLGKPRAAYQIVDELWDALDKNRG